jgi:hypothetical protein
MELPRIQEQIDLVRSMVAGYPNDLQMTYTAEPCTIYISSRNSRISSLVRWGYGGSTRCTD